MSPIYVYGCSTCKTETEEQFPIKNRPDSITCKNCNGPAHYQISGGVFVVNGANAANRYSGDSNYKWYGDKK